VAMDRGHVAGLPADIWRELSAPLPRFDELVKSYLAADRKQPREPVAEEAFHAAPGATQG